MSIIGSNILAGASGQATGYNLNNSLRFRASSPAYLSRTPASATNRKTWTMSFWVKRGTISTRQFPFGNIDSGGINGFGFEFNSADQMSIIEAAGTTTMNLITTQVFRDPSAWYHVVWAYDTTQTTAANRVKIYINSNQVTALSTATYPTLNSDGYLNSTQTMSLGRGGGLTSLYFDGYMTEINFVDGQALTPSSFGETSLTTGQWIPKAYSGSYGTNGFKLNFSDASAATAAAIGKDSSGNGNNWTPSGISVTAGVTYDAMLDSPTLTSATVSNYCVMNPLNAASTQVISFANLRIIDSTASAFVRAYSTFELPSSKIYFEATMTTAAASNMIGVGTSGNLSNYPGQDANSWSYHSGGILYNNAVGTTVAAATTAGDIVGVAVDMSAGKIWFSVNNTYVASGNPSAGTNPAFSGLTGSLFPIVRAYSATMDINFGQRPFSYTPPTGFVALNTYNLPTPTILQGNKYMDATTYTGNGTSQTITNAGAFKPDFFWVKGRSYADFHVLEDTVRGVTKSLSSEQTAAEVTRGAAITAFTSTGFTVGSDSLVNYNGQTTVAWQWQAGQGTTTAGTGTGGITSVTQSVSTTAGFSIVQFTASGSNGTVTHGLGVAPSVVIVKDAASAGNWAMYHKSLPSAAYYLYMNTTAAQGNTAQTWNSTAPTSSVFSIGTWHTADRQIAYCWAEIAGFSKAFSYTGNGSTDGSFVFCGFRPKFVLLKSSSTADDWYIHDSTRNTYNVVDLRLSPNLSSAEVQSAVTVLDFLSNGFKLRTSNGGWNGSGNTYIGIAFAENPFKNSNAR